jgi:hypothetical protein
MGGKGVAQLAGARPATTITPPTFKRFVAPLPRIKWVVYCNAR